ncbi:MAG: transposase [Spirochaetia bacterium]|nr:transposase [Spirochaetia bacterium]
MAKYKKIEDRQWQWSAINYSEFFEEDHYLNQLLNMVRKLDLSKFDENYRNDTEKGGCSALPVDRMLSLIIYSILYGNISMRALARDMSKRADLLFLSGGITIDHSSFCRFRNRHSEVIKDIFQQTVFLGVESGYIDLDKVCIDGSKIKAYANSKDMGDMKKFEKRYEKIKEICNKRYIEWEEVEDGAEKEKRLKKLSEANCKKEKLENALGFLESNKDKKRIHLNEPDALLQRDKGKMIIGYNAQIAVDEQKQMIIYENVISENTDHQQTVPIVREILKLQKNLDLNDKKTKFIFDSGYAGEENLEELEDADLYLPDNEFAGLRNKELKTEIESSETLEFKYNRKQNNFLCPANNTLEYKRDTKTKNTEYAYYSAKGCKGCSLAAKCLSKSAKSKYFKVRKSYLKNIKIKKVYPPGKGPKIHYGPLTLAMREKLRTEMGKNIFSIRGYIVEGVFGCIKVARNGSRFFRIGINKVRNEWTERCIAHNIAKLLDFRLHET